MHVVTFLNRCVCARMYECRGLGMRVKRATTLHPLHFLTTAVTNRPWTFRPWTPLFDALSVFISPCMPALPANALALVIHSWVPTRGHRWKTSRPAQRTSRWSGRDRSAFYTGL